MCCPPTCVSQSQGSQRVRCFSDRPPLHQLAFLSCWARKGCGASVYVNCLHSTLQSNSKRPISVWRRQCMGAILRRTETGEVAANAPDCAAGNSMDRVWHAHSSHTPYLSHRVAGTFNVRGKGFSGHVRHVRCHGVRLSICCSSLSSHSQLLSRSVDSVCVPFRTKPLNFPA